VCVCVCVCERERERERPNATIALYTYNGTGIRGSTKKSTGTATAQNLYILHFLFQAKNKHNILSKQPIACVIIVTERVRPLPLLWKAYSLV
jgi:hypothetical protein